MVPVPGRSAPGAPAAGGHRLAPHTADTMIEAWGPDRVTCLAEAVGALVSVFAEVPDTAATTTRPVALGPAPDADLLVALLEEVIYTVDALALVPARAHLADTRQGGIAGDLEVVDAAQVALVGPVPKAVSWHDLEIVEDRGTWRCRVVVDV